MWSRRALAGVALATLLSCPASAQIEDSWLEQVDPWGISYLGEDEPALRTRMWQGAHGEDLLALMQEARTKGLSPAEQILMRRLGDASRVRDMEGARAIAEHQEFNRAVSAAYAMYTGCTIKIVRNENFLLERGIGDLVDVLR